MHEHTARFGVPVSGVRTGPRADEQPLVRHVPGMDEAVGGRYPPIGGGAPSATISNQELLERIDAAMKTITTTELGNAILVPEQADRFIQTVEESTWTLSRFRRIPMSAPKRNIDRTDFSSGILQEPADEGEDFTGESSPEFFQNVLNATKARGRAPITDESLADNIERENFQSTLVDMIARRAGRDLQRLYVRGDTDGAGFLSLIDGWLKFAGAQLDGGTADFDATDVEDMFEAQLLALEPKYIEDDRSGWVYVVTFKIYNDYQNVLRARETDLGDTAQTEGSNVLRYKGIEVRHSGAVSDGASLLTHDENTVYGIYKDVEIEPERVAKADRWDFHVRVRTDADYEDENAAVAATGYTGP